MEAKLQFNKEGYITEIPVNCIINKARPNCGATTCEINSPRNSIIIEPNLPVIEGKEISMKGKFFPVKNGVKVKEIEDYLKSTSGYKKLMTTPESFHKIKEAFEQVGENIYNYFMLFDECHKIINDARFRTSITGILEGFFKCKERSLISASPFSSEDIELFKQQNFSICNTKLEKRYKKDITVISTNNTVQVLKNILSKNTSREYFIFLNSIDTSLQLIEKLGIKNESNIYCSGDEHNKNKLYRNGYHQFYHQIGNYKKYNFFTSRFFSALDIELDYKPEVIIFSDYSVAQNSVISPLDDSWQIIGRFRNGVSSTTHVALTTLDAIPESKELIKKKIMEDFVFYDKLKQLGETLPPRNKRTIQEILEHLPVHEYIMPNGELNRYRLHDKMKHEDTIEIYLTPETLKEAYLKCGDYFNLTFEVENFDEKDMKLTRRTYNKFMDNKEFIETFYYYHLDKDITSKEQETIFNSLKKEDALLTEACQLLPREFIEQSKFNRQILSREIIKEKFNREKIQVPVIALVMNTFHEDKKYTEAYIKQELDDIYKIVNLGKAAKATDISIYFETSKRRTVNNKGEKGYLLLKAKFTPSNNDPQPKFKEDDPEALTKAMKQFISRVTTCKKKGIHTF